MTSRAAHLLPEPFMVVTQNPIEYEGTYPLPEAQLDRFLFKLTVGYPTAEQEQEVLPATTGARPPTRRPPASGGRSAADVAAAREAISQWVDPQPVIVALARDGRRRRSRWRMPRGRRWCYAAKAWPGWPAGPSSPRRGEGDLQAVRAPPHPAAARDGAGGTTVDGVLDGCYPCRCPADDAAAHIGGVAPPGACGRRRPAASHPVVPGPGWSGCWWSTACCWRCGPRLPAGARPGRCRSRLPPAVRWAPRRRWVGRATRGRLRAAVPTSWRPACRHPPCRRRAAGRHGGRR